jgi:pimeloyl-ACP methyl ester carboxylesterase/DNA-binding CsgD family transcriptional regulator
LRLVGVHARWAAVVDGEIRYCTTLDGVRIAYVSEGRGIPVVFCHFVYTFSLSDLVPSYDRTVRLMGRGTQFIRHDIRGTGLSQREPGEVSSETTILDMEAVVDALGLEQFVLFGAAIGGTRAIQYAVRHPERVAGLLLYESCPRLLDAFPEPALRAFAQLARVDWPLAARTMADVAVRRQDEGEGLRWAELLERSLSGEMMAHILERNVELDVEPLLAQVSCPTVVCHARDDPLWPFSLGQKIAEGIPGARLVPLDGHEGGPFTNADGAAEVVRQLLVGLASGDSLTGFAEPVANKPLTPRETEILGLIATGMTSKEISRELSLSVRTVARHITNIYDKIGARGRADATAYALRNRLTVSK